VARRWTILAIALVVAVPACKSSGGGSSTGDAARPAPPAPGQAPDGTTAGPQGPTAAPNAGGPRPAQGSTPGTPEPQLRKCTGGRNCEEPAEPPPGSGSISGVGPDDGPDLPDGPVPLPPPTTALPPEYPPLPVSGEPTTAPPLPPAMEAHLARVPAGAGPQFVIQADVRAIAPAEAVRSAARAALAVVGEIPEGAASCAIELAAAVEVVTYAMQESESGSELGIALVDGTVDLPGILECMGRIEPDMPVGLLQQAAGGYVEVEEHIALASIGPRTIAFGSDELVRRAQAGPVAGAIVESPVFARARALAGSGPAYAVLWDASGKGDDMPLRGGGSLRLTPRLGVAGAFVFSQIGRVGDAIEEASEALDEIAEARGELAVKLGASLPAAVKRDLQTLIDAALGARLVLQGPLLSFDVWLPDGVSLPQIAGSLLQALPALDLL